MSNSKKFRVGAALKEEGIWEWVGGKNGKNMQLGGKAGFRMSKDLMLNHLDFIVEATKARHSSWGYELYFRKISLIQWADGCILKEESGAWKTHHKAMTVVKLLPLFSFFSYGLRGYDFSPSSTKPRHQTLTTTVAVQSWPVLGFSWCLYHYSTLTENRTFLPLSLKYIKIVSYLHPGLS